MLEELKLEYEVQVFKRDANFRAGPDLKKIHPLGKSPTIGITPAGSDKETVIAESATIIEYLCEHFGRQLIPQKYPEGKEGVLCAETEEWMRYKVRLSVQFPDVIMSDVPRHSPLPLGVMGVFHCTNGAYPHAWPFFAATPGVKSCSFPLARLRTNRKAPKG